MLLWLIVVSVALAVADAQDQLRGSNKGCSMQIESSDYTVSCLVASGSLEIAYTPTWKESFLLRREFVITCTENTKIVCEELLEAKPLFDEYLDRSKSSTILREFQVNNCVLSHESLVCALGLVGADGSDTVYLTDTVGKLETVHLEGLKGVTSFEISYDELLEERASIPYNVLSILSDLQTLTIRGLSIDMRPGPDSTLLNLTSLTLSGNIIKNIHRGAFKSAPEIKHLFLMENAIEFVDVDAFEGLTKLVDLTLQSNYLKHLPEGVFRHSPNIARLELSAHNLLDLSDNLFVGLNKLQEIFVFYNSEFDDSVALKLGNKTFSNLPSLTVLQLYSNLIKDVPAELFQNSTNLQRINLEMNDISYLPKNTFKGLKLTYLSLSYNKLSFLYSDVFSEQTSLTELNLSYNQLKSLPDGLFSDTHSLKTIYLDNNRLSFLYSDVFSEQTSMTVINLSQNMLKSLPDGLFCNTHSLQYIYLEHNSIELLTNDVFSEQTSLTELNLSHNQLKSLPDGLFSNTHSLQYIYLDENSIELLNKSTFEGLYNLNKLSLAWNRIENISQWIFECSSSSETSAFTFPSDAEIDLRHNLIRELEPPVNKNYTIRARFLLGDNPYRCDCFLYDFVDYRRRANLSNIIIEEAKCAEPDEMIGKSVVDWQLLKPDCEVDCATGGMIKHSSKDQNCKCTLNPIQLRLEMLCDNLPSVFPKLRQQIYSTYLKLRNVTNIPSLPPEVKIIDFSSANLTDFVAFAKSVVLNLTNNYFTKAPLKLFENNCSVYLSNNPFDCSCEGRDSIVALDSLKKFIRDYKNLTCSNGDYVSIIVKVIDDLCAADDGNIVIISVSIGIISILIIFFACVLLAFKYRTELRIVLRRLGLWRGDVHGGELYDAFVSYAHQDENFVIEKLLPNLERGNPPLKICIHNRDWVVGEYIPAQIARSVEQSRYTIIVLSRSFVDSVWGRLEFETAHAKDRVIILMLEDLSADRSLDPELRAYFSTKTYVKADDPLVWERLRDAVLRRKRALKNTNENQQLGNMMATTNF